MTDAPGTTVLAPRAAAALLTLQVRAAQTEAAEAEAALAAIDVEAALEDLRTRVRPLVDERRRAHEHELAAARAEANLAISEARRQAAEILAVGDAIPVHDERLVAEIASPLPDRSPLPDPVIPSVAAVPAEVGPVEATSVAVTPVAVFDDLLVEAGVIAAHLSVGVDGAPSPWAAPTDSAATTIPDGTTVMPVIVPISDDAAPFPGRSLGELASSATATDGTQVHVVLDSESFAQAFAAALGPVFERSPELGAYLPSRYAPGSGKVAKPGFWSHAWHPDVLLSGLAMVIVIVVLVAWAG